MSKMQTREEMLKALRAKMAERTKGRRDPDEFRPPKAKDGEKLEFWLRVLPPLQAGDTCKGVEGGVCEKESEFWFYENGFHFIQNSKNECPRIHDHDECPICKMGFDLMEDNDDKEFRRNIARKYLARSFYAVNVYFLNIDKNPENIRGKVMWMNLPKTLCDKMDECINNDNTGDAQDPKAAGIFYHPYEGGYTFKLVIEKQGDFNSYTSSIFLPASYGPLVRDKNGAPVEDKIQEILDKRFYLPTKFQPRDVRKLTSIADKMLHAESSGGDEDDSEEIEAGEAKAPAQKPAAAPAKKQAAAENVVEEVAAAPAAASEKKPTKQPVKKAEPAPAKEPPKAEATPPEDDPDVAKILSEINDQ